MLPLCTQRWPHVFVYDCQATNTGLPVAERTSKLPLAFFFFQYF